MQSLSIRSRITVLATSVVALVLTSAGVALVVVHESSLTNNLDTSLMQRADDIEALLESGSPPEELSQAGTESFAQMVSEDGEVIVATPNLTPGDPLRIVIPPGETEITQTIEGLEVDDDRFRVLSRHVEAVGVVHVGRTYDDVSESVVGLVTSLLVGIPVITVLMGMLVWGMVGRTLRPVEEIRAEVADIGSTDLHRRVPGTGSGDEIDRLAGTMNQMLQRVETSVLRQQRFVADASHELRNPLTRIRSALEVELASGEEPGTETLEEVLEEVVELQAMVEDLLYLARADAAHGKPKLRRVDLDDVVIRGARAVRSRRHVEIDSSRVSGAQVWGDPGQLSRAIRNLLANAERHAEHRVKLGLAEQDGFAVLTVSDDGHGIPAEHRELVFERFARLDEARSVNSGGTGLGLAIAREIAEAHNGSLHLVANESPGATFVLEIPLAD